MNSGMNVEEFYLEGYYFRRHSCIVPWSNINTRNTVLRLEFILLSNQYLTIFVALPKIFLAPDYKPERKRVRNELMQKLLGTLKNTLWLPACLGFAATAFAQDKELAAQLEA